MPKKKILATPEEQGSHSCTTMYGTEGKLGKKKKKVKEKTVKNSGLMTKRGE